MRVCKTRILSVKLNVCIWVSMSELKREDRFSLTYMCMCVYACVLVYMSLSAYSSNCCVYRQVIKYFKYIAGQIKFKCADVGESIRFTEITYLFWNLTIFISVTNFSQVNF